jgi:hypothetical protein
MRAVWTGRDRHGGVRSGWHDDLALGHARDGNFAGWAGPISSRSWTAAAGQALLSLFLLFKSFPILQLLSKCLQAWKYKTQSYWSQKISKLVMVAYNSKENKFLFWLNFKISLDWNIKFISKSNFNLVWI